MIAEYGKEIRYLHCFSFWQSIRFQDCYQLPRPGAFSANYVAGQQDFVLHFMRMTPQSLSGRTALTSATWRSYFTTLGKRQDLSLI